MKYLFIIYINRSGSTYLANQLSKLREILVCPEAEVLVNILLKHPDTMLTREERDLLGSAIVKDRKLKHWNLDIHKMNTDSQTKLELFFEILDHYRSTTKPGSRMIVFKAVDLIRHVEILHDFGIQKGFDILFISLIRDPRAIFNSQYQTYVEHRRRFMNRNPLATVFHWNNLVSNSIQYASLYSLVILKYEDLVNHFEKVMNQLLRFVRIQDEGIFNNFQGDLSARIPLDQLSMHPHINDPPVPAKANQWRNECNILTQEIIQQYTKEGLKQMEYPVFQVTQPGIIRLLMMLKYKVELALKDCYRLIRNTPLSL